MKWSTKLANDWQKVVPPSRPSYSELVIYDAYFSLYPAGSSVLILGSTPELRDMAYRHRFKTLVVDYNKINYQKLIKQKIHPIDNEKFLCCDWRALRIKKKVDIIAGDLALNMFCFDDQKNVLPIIWSLLKPSGIFVHRTWLYKPGKHSVKAAIKEYKAKRKNLHPFYALAMEMMNCVYNKERRCVCFKDLGPEAVYELKIRDFPAIVAIDSKGRSIYAFRRKRK